MRDWIRNTEEVIESYRRRKVLNGEWSETESHQKLKEKLAEIDREYPTQDDQERYCRLYWDQ